MEKRYNYKNENKKVKPKEKVTQKNKIKVIKKTSFIPTAGKKRKPKEERKLPFLIEVKLMANILLITVLR